MVGIWFWNSVYLRTNKIWPTSSAYRNIYFSEKSPNYLIMQFGKAISIPPLEQNFHFKSEREYDCTEVFEILSIERHSSMVQHPCVDFPAGTL